MNIRETIHFHTQFRTVADHSGQSRPIVRGHGKALHVALIPFPEYSVWVALHDDGMYTVQASRGGFKIGQAGAGATGDLRALVDRAVSLAETDLKLAATKRRKRAKR